MRKAQLQYDDLVQRLSSPLKLPQGLTVFSVHTDARLLKMYTLDLVGCFRLQEIVSLDLPVQKMSFQCNFRKLVQVTVAFAYMASAETTR